MHLKQYAAGLLSALTLTAMLSVLPAAAAGTETFGYQMLDDGTVAVVCKNPELAQADVPAMLDGYQVSALADGCFSGNTALTSVTLPEGLLAIGNDAFYGCEALAEITIPDSVTTLGSYAFYGCSALTEMALSASVTEIGDYAFDTTEGITAFTVDADNAVYTSQDGVLFDKDLTTLLKYPEARPDKSYTVPSSCKTIADWAMIGTQYLEQIDLGHVTSIGEDAFYYCVGLKSIVIPEGITELKGAVFCYCTSLESVTLPSTLKSIGENCFYSCTSLTDITLPEGLEKIEGYAFFHCTSLKALTIPKSVKTLISNCVGYYYSEDAGGMAVQEDFTAYVTKGTPAYRYITSNEIAWKSAPTNTIYYVLIGAAAVIIIGLIAGIIVVSRKKA